MVAKLRDKEVSIEKMEKVVGGTVGYVPIFFLENGERKPPFVTPNHRQIWRPDREKSGLQ
ncbi:MAG: hypothetical protein K6F95_01345 [Selenomonas sp.]|uniref:hypothetical protein n=1 Tax=Selenomonas sp. TaxID=2053611 RepID=UPI0025E6FEA7|nr:hypothetical protein [Selenomonas sp.]MCR5756537.1 hypothetical protein [Selenomonas sp.]